MHSGDYVLASNIGMTNIKQQNLRYELLKDGEFYKVSELTPMFLDPRTRHKETERYYFIKMK
jgi:hypothetical protein